MEPELNGNNVGNPNDPTSRKKDPDGNEITRVEKILSGLVLIGLTLWSALYLIAHWPDRLPSPKDNVLPLYTYEWFNVRLVEVPNFGKLDTTHKGVSATKTGIIDTTQKNRDTTDRRDSTHAALAVADSIRPSKTDSPATYRCNSIDDLVKRYDLMHINTILLILVAVAGFLGNMMYLSTSFTTFIGAGKFKRSWILWYCVKPFTASALAIAMYFVFRGGFLNMSDDSTNINLYGMITLAVLTGLFTDRATLKLKEVFDVLLRPKEDRPGKLKNGDGDGNGGNDGDGGSDPKITGVSSEPLEAGKPTTVTVTGQNLTKGAINVSVEGQPIAEVARQATTCSFSYTLPDKLKDAKAVTVAIKFANQSTASEHKLKVKPQPAN